MAGMEAALIAGIISALLTYAIQSVQYPKPIRCVAHMCSLSGEQFRVHLMSTMMFL